MEQQILYAIVALLTGGSLGGGGVLLRQKRNGSDKTQLLRDIRDSLKDIHHEITELRLDFARLEGRIG